MSPSVRLAAFLAPIFVAGGVNTAFLPLFLSDRGLSAAEIGEVLGLATLCRLAAVPGWGWIADRAGRHATVLFWSAALAAIACASYLPAHGIVVLLLVSAAQAVTASALTPLSDTLALALAGEGRLDYGRVRASGSAAFMAATAAAGPIVAAFGARVVPVLLAGSYAVAAALAALLPQAAAPPHGPRGAMRGVRLLTYRPFLLTLGASALIQGAHGAYYGLATVHWRAHGISDTAIGLLWSEGVVAEILLFVFGRRVAARLGPAGLTAVAAAASLLRWSLTALTTDLASLAAIQFLHGATYGMQHLSAMLMLSRTIPPERAAGAQTLHASLGTAVPTGLMMWAAGAAYDGSGQVFLLMAGLGGLGLLLAPGLATAARRQARS
ncbi:MFS transporter [Limobrevibacterium gyesilva]|uniref:MFS transporter n=1 Tax=Limobrevibacterium gyesilva TaxID=2991712 RepID=A0AA41YL37_9PROT|nr:MFS transporter [Limobrevibacterium gyesilva]MCW3474615.1 MFS transporter [Limobrevibacterium gyesilva]